MKISPATQVFGVTVDGDARDAMWNEGGGLLVGGQQLQEGEIVAIYGGDHRVVERRRVNVGGTDFTLIIRTEVP